MDLSIIVVTYNTKDCLEECLSRIMLSKDNLSKEIILVDNGSSDSTISMVKEKFPKIVLVENKTNVGFAGANNIAYKKVQGEYLLMLNSDAFIGPDTLQRTVDFMRNTPSCGILGCRLINREGKLQFSARYSPTPWRVFLTLSGIGSRFPGNSFLRGVDDMSWDHKSVRETDWVPGCFLLIRKKIIDSLDFFLREDLFMYSDDADLCLRVKRKGWKVFFYPEDVVHIGGATTERIGKVTVSGAQYEPYQIESRFIYYRKNYGIHYVLVFILLSYILFGADVLRRILSFGRKNAPLSETFARQKTFVDVMWTTRFGVRRTH